MSFISEVASIFLQRLYTGWITLRNQTATPIKMVGRRVIELYDALIAGNDWEITPYLSLKRRAGHTAYLTINSPALFLYSWKSNTMGTIPIFDTNGDVEYQSGAATVGTIYTKAGGSVNMQSSILGIGNYLYVGNPTFNFKWDGPTGAQGRTNWGISLPSTSSGPNNAGTGTNGVATGGVNWTNPNNVTSNVSFATVTLPNGKTANPLISTNFSFSVPGGSITTSIEIIFAMIVTGGTVRVQVAPVNGSMILGYYVMLGLYSAGTYAIDLGPAGLAGYGVVGGLSSSLVNSSNFGFSILVTMLFGTGTVEINAVEMTAITPSGPVATPTGSGSFSAVNGFTYVIAYGNSVSGEISNASQPSANTDPFTSKAYVGIPLATSNDPQVNQIHVYRTTDSGGGNQYFEIANSPFPNVGYTLTSVANASAGSTVYTGTALGSFAQAVGQNFTVSGFTNAANDGTFPATAATATTLTLTNSGGVAETHAATATLLAEDTTPDTGLQVTSQAEINLGNTPPPAGLTNLEYFAGRMWGSTNNLLYASTGPETISGTAPNSNWNPLYQFLIPGVIVRNVRGPNGMLVFTQDDCYIVRGTDITNYTVNEFVKDFGVRTYNAVDTDGTNLYVFTSDRQFIIISASGAQDIGLPIADQLLNVDPTQVYVRVNRYGLDSIVRILDVANNVYYDYNLNQQCWNLPGILQMADCTCAGSIEVSPGVWRLLLCSTSSGVSQLAYRDISNFQDLGTSYQPNVVFGSIQLADPGMLAKFGALGGFAMQYTNAGTAPLLSVLPNDIGATLSNAVGSQITGNFVSMSPNPFTIPPTLGNQPKGYRNLGYYYNYAKGLSGFVQNIQFQLSAKAENTATELIGFGIYGDMKQETSAAGQLPQLQGR